MTVSEADELSHPPGKELAWAEWWSLELHDAESGLGLVTRLDVRPNEGASEVALSVFVPDGGFVTARHVAPEVVAGPRLEVEGVLLEMIEPLRRWRVTYDGPSHSITDVTDAGKREAWQRSRLERLIVELEVTAAHPPVASEAGFAQEVHVAGEVWLSGDDYRLATRAVRAKGWSAPLVAPRLARAALTFGDDVSVLAQHASGDDADASRGWLRRGDQVVALRDVRLATTTVQGASLPSSFVLELTDDSGERHRIDGELPHVAPLPGFRAGREEIVHLALARARWAGVAGAGFVEDRHQPGASARSAEPVR